MSHDLPFDLQSLRAAYAAGLDVFEVVEEVYRRIQNLGDPGIFITVLDRSDSTFRADWHWLSENPSRIPIDVISV